MGNPNYNDIFTTTIENRSRKLADNVTKHNAVLDRMSKKGKIRPYDGGSKILEEIEYAFGDKVWYSGYDTITDTHKQLFTAAEYAMKMLAVPVSISGEDQLKNSGKEAMIDLFQKRIENAEKTMADALSAGLFADGTGNGGKEIGGLQLLVADAPTSGIVGNIDRSVSGNEFWRNQSKTAAAALTAATIRSEFDEMLIKTSRGSDRTDMIVADATRYNLLLSALEPLQRFTNPDLANAGFKTVQYQGTDVVYDANCPAKHVYFLNTDYIYLRPHKDRNMKVIGGDRMAINQDAIYKIIGWAGNMTMSNAALQGVLIDK